MIPIAAETSYSIVVATLYDNSAAIDAGAINELKSPQFTDMLAPSMENVLLVMKNSSNKLSTGKLNIMPISKL